jgi:hypothetical protein
MDKEIRAQRIAAKLTAVERSIDDTLALSAELMIELRAGATEFNLAAQTSDGVFSKLVEAMGELQAARTNVVGSHKRLDKIREFVGLRPIAGISTQKSSIDEETIEEVTASVVERRRA